MDDDFWETFNPPASDFVKFENVGDTVTGTIRGMRKPVFDGRVVLQFDMATAEGLRTLTVGQTQLQRLLKQLAPRIGDKLTIKYTGKRGKMKTFEVFQGDSFKPAPADAAADVPF